VTRTSAGFVAVSLLFLFASCGKPLPLPGDPPPDALPGAPPDASPGAPPDAPLPPEEICGDGDVDPGEECDTGDASATCDVDCTAPACGDSTVNPAAGEHCDDGNAVAGDDCTGCRRDCGNGMLDPGEECDEGDGDGNGFADPTTDCDSDCTAPACGDGSFNPAVEETCDDGNDVSADGCSAGCVSEISVTGTHHAELETILSGIWRFDGTGWQRVWEQMRPAYVDDHWAAGPLEDYLVGSVFDEDQLPAVRRGGEALFHHGPGVSELIELEGMLGEGLLSFRHIWGARTEPVTLYVITDRYDLLRYDATGWAGVELPRPLEVIDVWGTGPDDVYILGWNGYRFHFDGTSWIEVQDLPPFKYCLMGGTGPSDMLVAGDDSVSRFDGNRWTQWTVGLEEFRIRKLASSGDGSFAVMDRSRVGIFDEGEWRYFDFTGQVELNDMTMLPNGHVFAVGGTLVFRYDGQDWDIQDVAPPTPPLYGEYGPLMSIQFAPGLP
jgi:cysteine-rich repeat protein